MWVKDGNYRAVICTTIDQYRRHCNYILVPTTYNSNKRPTVEDLKDNEILGRQIGTGYDQQTTKEHQPGIERIWKLVGGNCNFFFGVDMLTIDHKDFINFKDKFEKVGSLQIVEGLKQYGSLRYEGDFEIFEEIFGDLDNYIKVFKLKKYPVATLCEI